MGKVVVVAGGPNGTIQAQAGSFTFLYPGFYLEKRTGKIRTGHSFTKRGDKDCHHVSLDGFIMISREGVVPLDEPEPEIAAAASPGFHWMRGHYSSTYSGQIPKTVYRTDTYQSIGNLIILVDEKGFHPRCQTNFTWSVKTTGLTGEYPADPQSQIPTSGVVTRSNSVVFDGDWAHVTRHTREWSPTETKHVWPPGGFIYNFTAADPITERDDLLNPDEGWWVRIMRSNGKVVGLRVYDESKTRYTYFAWSTSNFLGTCPELDSTASSVVENYIQSMDNKWTRKLLFATRGIDIPKDVKTELIERAINDAKVLQINSVAFLRDLLHVKELILPILKLKKKPFSAKSWANLWLTYDYGIRLLVQDIHEVVSKVPRSDVTFSLTHVRSGLHRTFPDDEGQEVDVTYHAKLLLSPSIGLLDSALTKLRSLDLILSRENLWDFVPYSFVIDWFIPFGDYLAGLDLQNDLNLFGAKTAIFSSKASMAVPTDPHPILLGSERFYIAPTLSAKVYDRWHEPPTISLPDIALTNGLNLHRVANGSALVVQKI